MGCVPSKGKVSSLPGAQKSEYQHSLPDVSSVKKETDAKNFAPVQNSTTKPEENLNEKIGSNALVNGKKGASVDTPTSDTSANQNAGSFPIELNETKVTETETLEMTTPSTFPAQLNIQIEPDSDVTASLLPEKLSGAPVVVDVAEKSPRNRRYLSDDPQAIPTPEQQLAATIIQAVYRGHLVRKTRVLQKKNKEEDEEKEKEESEEEIEEESEGETENERATNGTTLTATSNTLASVPADNDENPVEEIDIDLNDPDVEKAALKIQGAFRGLKMKRSS